MKGGHMRYHLLIVLLVAVLLSAGCVGGNKENVITSTPTPTTSETLTTPSTTSQVNQNDVVKNGIIIFRNPEKIIKPEDLQIGDLIQMSSDDSRYDKDHGWILENISSQNNQYLIKQIVKFKPENRWFGIKTTNALLISSGALMRDYRYKIGHAFEPLPQKCLTCGYGSSDDVNWCSHDALMFLNCDDPRILYNRSSAVIYPP